MKNPSKRQSGIDSRARRDALRLSKRRAGHSRALQIERLEQLIMMSTVTEVEPNDTLALATALQFTEDPPGSHFYTTLGTGSIATPSDVDYWNFSGHAGDPVSISGDGGTGTGSVYLELRNSSDQVLAQASDYQGGHPEISNFVLPNEGTYYVVARTYGGATLDSYDIRVDLPRGISGESEPNDSIATATPLVLSPKDGGHASGIASGNITTPSDVDTFSLGNLKVGDQIDASLPEALKPGVSTLAPRVEILDHNGNTVASAIGYGQPDGTNHARFTATADDQYYLRVSPSDGGTAGPQALYLLSADIVPAAPAAVLSTTLPSAAISNNSLLFDGVNDHVVIPDSASLRPASLTLEGWVNFSTLDHNAHVIYGKQLGNALNSYALWYQNGNLYGAIGDQNGDDSIAANFSPQVGIWYHVALTFDAGSGELALLINGSTVNSTTSSRSIGYDANPFIIGGATQYGALANPFAGQIDETQLWNSARSAADIQADMSRRLTGGEPGLQGYWPFEQTSGLTAPDLTSNHNDGTLGGLNQAFEPTWTTSGQNGGALNFNGVNQFVQLPQGAASADFSDGLTIELWADPTAITSWQRFVDLGNGPNSDNILLARDGTTNDLTLQIYQGSSLAGTVRAPDAIELNVWQHFSAVLYPSGDVSIYKNGELIASGTSGLPLNITRTQNFIGKSNWSADGYYGGSLDDVSLWNVPLSQEQIQANMASGPAGTEPGLLAYYKFDDGGGSTAIDSSPNHNDGSLGNVSGGLPTWTANGAPLTDPSVVSAVVQTIDHFSVTFDSELLAAAADDPNNYSLVAAGPDGIFGTSDDQVYALQPTFQGLGSRTVNFQIEPNPLQPGDYQFRTLAGLIDRAGVSVKPYTLGFEIDNPQSGTIEGTLGDGTIPGATPLPMTESPAGSGFFTTLALGTLDNNQDVDYYRFSAKAGDVITVEVQSSGYYIYPTLYLQDSAGNDLASTNGGYYGSAVLQNIVIPADGDYYIRFQGTY